MTDDDRLPRLRAGLWVKAQIRICGSQSIPAVIGRRGDPDQGSVLVKVYRGKDDCTVSVPMLTMEGEPGWMKGTGPEPVSEQQADAYIQRQTARDSDLWVLEIDDHESRYVLDNVVA